MKLCSPYKSDNYRNNGNHEQNMNNIPDFIWKAEEADQPEYNQNYGDDIKQISHSFLKILDW
jgi:hypothetical protein